MKLEQLYENFGKATVEQQADFISAYRVRRTKELAVNYASAKRKSSRPSCQSQLTEEEKNIMKLLGLKLKDIIALRESFQEVGSKESEDSLLKDFTYDEEEE